MKFKFTHKFSKNIVYTAKIIEDEVLVTWGVDGSAIYPLEQAKKCIEEGYWLKI